MNTMMQNFRHVSGSMRTRTNTDSLSLDEMRRRLPAIFAPQAHESRSARYVYISTADMLEAMISKDFLPVAASVSRSRDEGRQGFAKHMIRFRHRADLVGVPTERRVGDTSFEVVLRNAHDGTASYQFMAGLLRLVCLNGMVVSDGTVADVKVLHSGNRERQLDQVIEGAFTVLGEGPKVIEHVKNWQEIELSRDEQHAFAEEAHTIRFADADGKVSTPIRAEQLLHTRRSADGGNALWQTFNRIQENVIRAGERHSWRHLRDGEGRARQAEALDHAGDQGHRRRSEAQQGALAALRADGRPQVRLSFGLRGSASALPRGAQLSAGWRKAMNMLTKIACAAALLCWGALSYELGTRAHRIIEVADYPITTIPMFAPSRATFVQRFGQWRFVPEGAFAPAKRRDFGPLRRI